MAEENTATSSHLDSYMHVYDNGTTARLYVTPWDRNTVADGYWQTVNTIQPLINRDIYLADALDKLAAKYIKYNEGAYINIYEDTEHEDSYYISVDDDELFKNLPHYSYNKNFFTQTKLEDGTYEIGMRFKDETITADANGIYCNVEHLINATKCVSSISALSASGCSALTYEYKVSEGNFTFTSMLPINLGGMVESEDRNWVYLVG